ncbi:uncharacterized protein LACBIDRAFT_303531 [Laccaria bicolor S238N-H82]|uniref:Predicted protein n=1 Tax=Laccaria bicolor (strain S238N-H82 / ATCC MYA-4686) TaxID=486041 RepID=B0DJM9_LACBS|nr:uncharacterized protein LACBIDRAFT_303531 [Laccaria bicolor S238N-H82]EDR05146.1 predicted protein [Laccaria bicolor S238N-H82]|eukprot:XP_001884111.1 predicted protein [Laccaria bicolor S238N-H82]
MENLETTLTSLGKCRKAERLVIQAQDVESRVIGATSHHANASMTNVQETEETSTMNFDKKVSSLSNFVKKSSKIMSKIARSFHKKKSLNADLGGTTS